jgi:hypothetical protein
MRRKKTAEKPIGKRERKAAPRHSPAVSGFRVVIVKDS